MSVEISQSQSKEDVEISFSAEDVEIDRLAKVATDRLPDLQHTVTDSTTAISAIEPDSTPKPVTVSCDLDDDNDEYIISGTTKTIHNDSRCIKPDPNTLQQLNASMQLKIQNHIQSRLLHNALFWIRISVLLLTMILMLLSLPYAFGSVGETKLVLMDECPGYEIEEIWQHSKDINSQTGSVSNLRSRDCWHTSTLDIDESVAFGQNSYHYQAKTNDFAIFQCVIFSILTMFSLITLIYGSYSLVMDICAIREQTLYKRSTKFKYFIQTQAQSVSKSGVKSERAKLITCLEMFQKQWNLCCGTDANGYICRKIMIEVAEIILQTFALLLYNGYNIFNPYHVSLAYKPQFIYIFACMLSFNCICVATLWALYVLKPNKCNGSIFNVVEFCVDEFCDLFYAIYPFIVVFGDSYNSFDDHDVHPIWIGFALLHNKEMFSFVYSVFPMFLLCTKSFVMTHFAVQQMRNNSFELWMFVTKIMKTSDDKKIAYLANILGFTIHTHSDRDIVPSFTPASPPIDDEIYDEHGNLKLNISNTWNSSGDKSPAKSTKCRVSIAVVSLLFILYAVILLSAVINHLQSSEKHCNNAQYEIEIVTKHPELFVYNQCVYKVYPFSFSDDISDNCECRVFQINWFNINISYEYLQEGITPNSMIDGVFKRWKMLEKFYTNNIPVTNTAFEFKASHFVGIHMKLFSWTNIPILNIDEAIQNWKELLFFGIGSVDNFFLLPNTFSELTKLHIFEIGHTTKFNTSLEILCNCTDLITIRMVQVSISSIPKCISNLPNLQLLQFHLADALTSFPFEILNTPNLQQLDLWKCSIAYQSLMANNKWNHTLYPIKKDLTVFLDLNPICIEVVDGSFDLGSNQSVIGNWMTQQNACRYSGCDAACPPSFVGNGLCNNVCNDTGCYMDGGDCYQFCFTFTQCNYTQFSNDVCDEECNNEQCFWDNGYCRNETSATSFDYDYIPILPMLSMPPNGTMPGSKGPKGLPP